MANFGQITMTWNLEWDEEVDVVCTDAGVAGLTGAISAVDGGAEVLVASAPAPGSAGATGGSHGWFTLDSGDGETAAYFAELSEGLDVAALTQLDGDLPIRLVADPAATGRRVAPFVGSQLQDWAARCIPSPSGYLYTRVTDWNSTAMESGDGAAIEVTEIGSMAPDPGDIVASVLEWLDTEARLRGVDFEPVTRFERLVFEEGQVIGAVFTTSDGLFAVRARHGVLLCRAGFPDRRASPPREAADSVLGVALVSKAASRFGRVELLTSDPAVARAVGTPSVGLEHA